jgi:hypothetical protein
LLDNGVAEYRKKPGTLACIENGSFAIAFNPVFSVCTLRSASPFVAGCPGAIRFRKIQVCPQYDFNWSLAKIAALSDTTTYG